MTVLGIRATSKGHKAKPDIAQEAGDWGGQFSHPYLTIISSSGNVSAVGS